MTVGIAARFADGVVIASDSSITLGDDDRYTSPHIKAMSIQEGAALFAGDLNVCQRVLRKAAKFPLLHVIEREKFVGDEDCEFLVVRKGSWDIYIMDRNGSMVECEDWGAIGSGGKDARMLLEALYKKRSYSYVESTLKTIVGIIQKYNPQVYQPVRTQCLFSK